MLKVKITNGLILILENLLRKLKPTSVAAPQVEIQTHVPSTRITKEAPAIYVPAEKPYVATSYSYNPANPRPLNGREKLREQLHLAHCESDKCYKSDPECPIVNGVHAPCPIF